jgi:hypothetical protein
MLTVAFIIHLLALKVLMAQVLPVGSIKTCPACVIEWKHVLTLGATDDAPLSGMPAHIARASDGTIYVVDQRDRLPQVLGKDGRQARTFGRRGAGPGEYQEARAILIGADRRLHIIDPVLNRRTILSPTGELLGTASLGAGTMVMGDAAALPNGHFLINRVLTDPEGAGFALHEIDASGKRLRLFAEGDYNIRRPYSMLRRVFARQDGGVWVAHEYSNLIERHSKDGSVDLVLKRDADWLKPLPRGESPSGGDFDRPPTPAVKAIWEDADGLLWTATNVASTSWKPGPTFAEWRTAGEPPRNPPQQNWDTVIEVLDPGKRVLLTSLRVHAYVVYNVLNGYLASYREDDDGTPLVDLWRVNLKRSP